MRRLAGCLLAFSLFTGGPALAQQVADPLVDLTVAAPTWSAGTGPRLSVDHGHDNFHRIDGRYAPFAALMTNEGYRVAGLEGRLTTESLAGTDILVIANALGELDDRQSVSGPAFTADEAAVLRAWIEGGGSLLLIADHAPFPSAVTALSEALGVDWDNGYAMHSPGSPDVFTRTSGDLSDSPIIQGQSGGVDRVRTFTGSSFQPPEGSTNLIRLGEGWRIYTPDAQGDISPNGPSAPISGRSQMAAFELGRGRVVLSGEAAAFTAQVSGPNQTPMGLRAEGAEQNKTALLNLMRWLARGD